MPDNIFEHKGGKIADWSTGESPAGWYFWDEGSNHHGPFSSHAEAQVAFNEYFETV
jgi:hypothetical protein